MVGGQRDLFERQQYRGYSHPLAFFSATMSDAGGGVSILARIAYRRHNLLDFFACVASADFIKHRINTIIELLSIIDELYIYINR